MTIQQAIQLGKDAFHNGIIAAPVFDKEFITQLYSEEREHTLKISLYDGWNTGWHTENLIIDSKWGDNIHG